MKTKIHNDEVVNRELENSTVNSPIANNPSSDATAAGKSGLVPIISRFPTSDWLKNDPLLRRWAQEEAAAKSSDTLSTTDVAQRTSEDDRTLGPNLEAGKVNPTSFSNPLAENLQAQREKLLEPMISRLPTSDWMKNDPVLQRWAQEEAAAKSSKTPEIPQSIQAKLTVSTPGDKYEQEADAMAAKVMAMPDTAIEPQQQTPSQPNSTTAALQRAGQSI